MGPKVVFYRHCACVCVRSEEHTSELQSHLNLVCRLLLEKKKTSRTTVMRDDGVRLRTAALRESHAHSRLSLLTPSKPQRLKTSSVQLCFSFFFNDTATTEIYTLSLHDALPI